MNNERNLNESSITLLYIVKKHFEDLTFEIKFDLKGQDGLRTLVLHMGTKLKKEFQSFQKMIALYSTLEDDHL